MFSFGGSDDEAVTVRAPFTRPLCLQKQQQASTTAPPKRPSEKAATPAAARTGEEEEKQEVMRWAPGSSS